MMYNSSILSFYTPDSFPVPENLRQDHDRLVNQGSVLMKSKKAVIAILVRDQESKLIPEMKRRQNVWVLYLTITASWSWKMIARGAARAYLWVGLNVIHELPFWAVVSTPLGVL